MKLKKQHVSLVFTLLFMFLLNKIWDLIPTTYIEPIIYLCTFIGFLYILFDICFVIVRKKYSTIKYIVIADVCLLISAGVFLYYCFTSNKSNEITFILKRNNEILISYTIFMIVILVRAYLKSTKFKISTNSTDVIR